MKEVSYLFGALQDRNVDALMRIGAKERLQVGATLITEGDCPDAIYLILEGALTVSVTGHDTPIASVGKGEIVGEMSLLESQPASATVCATTPVTALRIARTALAEQLASDGGFSLRFYRALGMLLSHRLRILDSAETLQALAALPSNWLEALKGDRKGQYSIRVNDQWRVCFVWNEGAYDVEIVDYH